MCLCCFYPPLGKTLICRLQFTSHKVYCVIPSVPTTVATITAVELADSKTILFTTSEPHQFKSRRTLGQLDVVQQQQDIGVMAQLLQTALKVTSVPTRKGAPSPVQFTIQNPFKRLQSTELASLSSRLQAKTLQMTFGYAPADFHST